MLGAKRVKLLCSLSLCSHMYNYLYKFHLLKPASANSQVTLVTCSGACKTTRFRKVWFYLVKRPLLGANVSKTPLPEGPRPCRRMPFCGSLADQSSLCLAPWAARAGEVHGENNVRHNESNRCKDTVATAVFQIKPRFRKLRFS